MTVQLSPAETCAREPIHLSGAIQPHGFLISCHWPEWTVQHASTNVEQLLELPLGELIGTSLREHVDEIVLQAVADLLPFVEPGAAAQRVMTGNIGPTGALCDVTVHLQQDLVHLEIEPLPPGRPSPGAAMNAQVMISRVAGIADAGEFFNRVAEQVHELTGYDRVMIYRFRHDDAGEVIAEAVADGVESYLGLRYPGSDIPAQARRLYLVNRLRVIPDITYTPVPIQPPVVGGEAMDLGQHVLRSVSPVHLQYLRNMGIAASMSISIVSGGRLWGLIACHHRVPRRVPSGIRAVADLFGMYVSMRVASGEQAETLARFEKTEHFRDQLGHQLRDGVPPATALVRSLPDMRQLLSADGVQLDLGAAAHIDGRVPEKATGRKAAAAWSAGRPEHVTMTDDVADWMPPRARREGLAGLLSIPLAGGDGLRFFRAEQVEDVRWAGEPKKALVATDDGQRIAPRRSFAEWRQTVRGRGIAWSDDDRRTAERLAATLQEVHRRAQVHDLAAAPLAPRNDPGTRQRLDHLGSMMADLSKLDDQQARVLASRITALEQELQQLIATAPAAPSPTPKKKR